MFLINNTQGRVSFPIKSHNKVITLSPGEKSEEFDDKLYTELAPYIRAFNLSMEGYQATHGSVVRKHSGNTVTSDPKENSGAYKAKEREKKANDFALARSKAAMDVIESNKAAKQKASEKLAEAEQKAEQNVAETPTETKAKSTSKSPKAATKRTRRSTLNRKANAK
ncbi:hypothetical protein [Pseudoalteromonas umbrosa]|uniref:hypothetical protein n=1 Tax=Pseudoalteromonas umbrosa TaxID=3048489 RepID=UPI0024C223E9|nr:hypothetical protein [Pseudoalteromonas sp. B95]MDK1290185.1 hypothetical protein [Pseudoalteromonas sp. B95]